MHRRILGLCIACVLAALASAGCGADASVTATDARIYVSGAAEGFAERTIKALSGGDADVTVQADEVYQTMEGFGGAFNEKGWQALSVLRDAGRQEVLGMIFDRDKGLSLTICRVPIGASDYALDRYTEDETPGDYAMAHFSIDRDRKMLIPYVRAALAIQPSMRLWASAWTPPTWMKENGAFDSGALKDDPRVYAAYALYLAKFIKAYRAEGLPLEAVAVQNEPLILTAYPSCSWTGDQYLVFVRDYLGPLFQREGISKAIMLGTFNQMEDVLHLANVLNDVKAREYVSIVGFQWSGNRLAHFLTAAKPDTRLWQTETDCGNHHWEPGFDPDKPQNDFAYAASTWTMMRDYLTAGASVYDMWNMVLDQTGKSIDSQRPWPQNSAIVVDSRSGSVTYTPMFYAFGSFSRYVVPGSKRIGTSGRNSNAVAFVDPSGRTIVVLTGRQAGATSVSVKVRDTVYRVELPSGTFGTLVVDAHKP